MTSLVTATESRRDLIAFVVFNREGKAMSAGPTEAEAWFWLDSEMWPNYDGADGERLQKLTASGYHCVRMGIQS